MAISFSNINVMFVWSLVREDKKLSVDFKRNSDKQRISENVVSVFYSF